MKNTKRSLLLSALALVICVTMLIGSTFAWFTDTASTAVNTIQSGKLDVVLEKFDEAKGEWVTAEGQTLSFKKAAGAPANEEVLWEPGCTYELPLLRVRNNGNLALKYEISVIGGKGDLKLFDVISFTAAIDGAAEVPLSTFTGHLDAKDASSKILIKGHMDEDAGNEYQDLKIESIAINVLATQYTYEYDSNSNQYDKDAIYGDVKVTTDAELKAAIEDPEIKVIAIDGNLTYDWGGDSYANSKALLMKGNTFLGADADASITFAGYGSANPIVDTVFKNIIVKDTTVGDDENAWEHGYLEFKNLTAVNVTFADSIMLSGSNYLMDCTIKNPVASWYGLWIEGGSTVIKDSTFTGTRAVKIHEANGSDVESVVIDNCVFNTLSEKPGVAIGTLDATTKVTIKNSIFASCQPGDQGLYIYETDTDVSTINFTNKDNAVYNNAKFVSTAAELIALGGKSNEGVIILTADIDLNRAAVPTIGAAYGKELVIVGNGYTISNGTTAHTTHNGMKHHGLFYAYTNSTLTISDLVIEDVVIDATADTTRNYGAGIVVAYADVGSKVTLKNVDVKNCDVKNNTPDIGDEAGVYVGYQTGTLTMIDCDSTGCTVAGETAQKTGAFIGMVYGTATLTNCTTDLTIGACNRVGGTLIEN